MAITIYSAMVDLGFAFGLLSMALTVTGFIRRKKWSKNRLVFTLLIGFVLCSISIVCITWSFVIDVQEGDWQSLIDTAVYSAVCFTGITIFDLVVGFASLFSQKRTES